MNLIKFIESHQMFVLGLLWLFMVALLVCTLIIIVTLIKKGDERKGYVVRKPGLTALVVGIIFLILDIIWNIFFEQNSSIGFEDNPIIYVGIISIAFNISYLINMRKYR